MDTQRTLASPQSIVWSFHSMLRRQLDRVPIDESETQEELALCLFLAVNVIESFINVYFRVVVSFPNYKIHEFQYLKDIDKRISLERKIKEWPKLILGNALDLNKPQIRDFIELKNQRNSLMHFVSTHESIELPGSVRIHGLSDLSPMASLTLSKAQNYPQIIRNFAYEIFTAKGVSEEKLPHAFHSWFGIPAL